MIPARALAGAVTFTWPGRVLAISCPGTTLRFRAPGVLLRARLAVAS